MAIPWKSALLAIIVALFAVFVGYWRLYLINPITFQPTSLKGKTALVTGATEGIGKETAVIFASWGAELILPVRNTKKGEALKKEILKEAPKAKVTIYDGVDFADFQSVRDFAKKVEGETIDILVNNAGMLAPTVEATKDGVEVMYQVNHLSPFLLTHLLMPALRRATAARVVFVSSFVHYFGEIGNYKYSEERKGMQEYRASMRYDDSKLMNVMATMTFAENFSNDTKVTFNAVHPGIVISNIERDLQFSFHKLVVQSRLLLGRSSREGSIPQVTVATHPSLEGVTGKYFTDYCIGDMCSSCYYCDKQNGPGMYLNEEAYNKTTRDWLWNVSKKLTGI